MASTEVLPLRKVSLPQMVSEIEQLLELALTVTAESPDSGEELAVIAAQLRQYQKHDVPAKVDAIVWVEKRIRSEIASGEAMACEVQAFIEQQQKRLKGLRDMLAMCVQQSGGKLRGHVFTAKMGDNQPELVYDTALLPIEYCTIRHPRLDVNEKLLRRDLNAKKEIPGAKFLPPVKRLEIRANARKSAVKGGGTFGQIAEPEGAMHSSGEELAATAVWPRPYRSEAPEDREPFADWPNGQGTDD